MRLPVLIDEEMNPRQQELAARIAGSAALSVRRAEKGVPVTAKVWRELTQNADKLGITPPEARSQG